MGYFSEFDHGGNVYRVARILGVSPAAIRDLSSSVNPLFSAFIRDKLGDLLSYLEFYPEPYSEELKEILAEKLRIPKEKILFGNGSIELITLALYHLIPRGSKVLLLEPTFIAYRRILKDLHHKTLFFSLNTNDWFEFIENFLKKETGCKKVVIICNPNNPTGWLLLKSRLREIISREGDTLFFVDEAFIDFCEEDSLVYEATQLDNLLVFRSLTKFYGLAGARSGYMVSHHKYIDLLKRLTSPWNVSTISQILSKYVLINEDFKKKSLEFFLKEKKRFEEHFLRLKINFFPSVTNFYLFYLPTAKPFVEWLLRERKVLIRTCENFYGLSSDYLRVSIKDEESNKIFFEALEKWLKGF
ncbi:MAG: histidinol-phosphate aminotransferase family protein [Caldimicrobium sp.]|nr:histidinol-phosphate aminotransferase family protein [Caldimicrobium sp.]MCX7614001.1 histidinol-phosphate aminotransferase family protein [Caldimicrobium sp.]MDW8182868.1 histidinol-phosphate transaminase [Caldimicrobium sp.]